MCLDGVNDRPGTKILGNVVNDREAGISPSGWVPLKAPAKRSNLYKVGENIYGMRDENQNGQNKANPAWRQGLNLDPLTSLFPFPSVFLRSPDERLGKVNGPGFRYYSTFNHTCAPRSHIDIALGLPLLRLAAMPPQSPKSNTALCISMTHSHWKPAR